MQYQLGDTLISVGTYIRSYDFPNYIDTYMEGVVIKSELGLLVVRTFNTVVDGVRRQTSSNQETFTTADVGESWYDEVYPDWKRLEVLDNEK